MLSSSNEESVASGENPGAAWYCVRTQPKHEHIAAAQLRQGGEVEVFLPRIRFQRATRAGAAWFVEALFPNYLFARFELASDLRRVQSGRGIRGVVHFGSRWPEIPGPTIEALRAAMGDEEIRQVPSQFKPGEAVEISQGALGGLQAVVSRVMSNEQRVAVLLEFLGQQVSVELPIGEISANQFFPQRFAFGRD